MYRERPSRLTGVIRWEQEIGVAGSVQRVLPDGCLDLIWTGGELLVAGPDTAAFVAASTPGTTYAALRFRPGLGPAVLGLPAVEVRDQRVPLTDLWKPRLVRALSARICAAQDPIAALEQFALDALTETAPDPVTTGLAARLSGGDAVAEIARESGLSERTLHRRCLDAFGYGPKTLARILRLQRALALARGGTPLARVAADAGYADQPHLARDVKALAGVPITALLAGS